MTESDRELVVKCLARDAQAVRRFIERFQQMVFGLCIRTLGNREDAEDVSQEVLLRAIRHMEHWDPNRPLKPWVLAIAANRCRTALSSRARHPISTEYTDQYADPSPQVSQLDLAEELQCALERVRDEYRLCFVLRHVNGLSLAEIGEIVGCPEGTVKTWLFRVRRELAEYLTRRGVVPAHHELH